jgi:4-alpha-glucanotransferase
MENKDGVYVRYPAEELYAIANLESHRNRCELVGENLGTVPGHVNETLHRRGWRGMYVLQFSLTGRREEPASSPPRGSVLSVNTHDTPTFAGFCGGRDIDYRVAAGFLASSEAERERQKRAEALSAFDEYLGLGGDGDGTGPALRRRLHAWLSYLLRCAEGRVMVALEDLWLEEEPQNRPGTVGPKNWSRRLRYNMETLRENPDLVPDFTLPR